MNLMLLYRVAALGCGGVAFAPAPVPRPRPRAPPPPKRAPTFSAIRLMMLRAVSVNHSRVAGLAFARLWQQGASVGCV